MNLWNEGPAMNLARTNLSAVYDGHRYLYAIGGRSGGTSTEFVFFVSNSKFSCNEIFLFPINFSSKNFRIWMKVFACGVNWQRRCKKLRIWGKKT